YARCSVRAETAAAPLVPMVAPVAAVAFGEERDAGEVLRALVSELDGRVDPRGRAICGAEERAVLSVDDQRLGVHRALDVPALVIVVVERLEVDVARIGGHADVAREIGQPNAGSDGDRRPALDAEVFEAALAAGQLLELVERQPLRPRDKPADLEVPDAPRGFVPDGHLVGDE